MINFKFYKKASTLLIVFAFVFSCTNKEKDSSDANHSANMTVKGTQMSELTAPPFVPACVGDRRAKKLIVNM